jgi:hypothetical protein
MKYTRQRKSARARAHGISHKSLVFALFATLAVGLGLALFEGLKGGAMTRADVLLRVADDAELKAKEKSRAFVLMEYYGYLRRDPDAGGYYYWLGKLDSFGGDFIRAEMVKAFLASDEYRHRFDR